MNGHQKYLELRETAIRPAMEKLKAEYEAQDYKCSIGEIKPPDITNGSRKGTVVVRSTFGALSLTRKQIVNDIEHTVSIFLSDGGSVDLIKMGVRYHRSFKFDEITPELIEKEIREAFK